MSQSILLAKVLNSCTFYRNALRGSTWALLLSTILSLAAAGFALYKVNNPKPPIFIICTVDGRMIPVDTLKHRTRL